MRNVFSVNKMRVVPILNAVLIVRPAILLNITYFTREFVEDLESVFNRGNPLVLGARETKRHI